MLGVGLLTPSETPLTPRGLGAVLLLALSCTPHTLVAILALTSKSLLVLALLGLGTKALLASKALGLLSLLSKALRLGWGKGAVGSLPRRLAEALLRGAEGLRGLTVIALLGLLGGLGWGLVGPSECPSKWILRTCKPGMLRSGIGLGMHSRDLAVLSLIRNATHSLEGFSGAHALS